MSYFFLDGYESMETYQPGEQPHDRPYIKLNANESSYPPSPAVLEALSTVEINSMSHYEDPYNLELRKTIGDIYGFPKEQIFVGNGADEVLSFIMMSFFREGFPIASTDITYDFYRTYATTFHLDYHKIPLKDDFSADVDALVDCGCDVVLANPNNPTGRTMPMSDIERIVAKDPKRLVIVDEAYVDYGGETCLPLVDKYPNIIVVRTFSKSRNMAGDRDKLLCSTFILPFWFLDLMKKRGYQIIETDRDDPFLTNNCLCLEPGKVLFSARGTRTIKNLEAAGIEVIPVDISEINKLGGGIHCSTLTILRDHIDF